MKKVWVGLVMGALLVVGAVAQGQTACSTTNPCVKLAWTATGMAVTVTTDGSGLQTAGPGSSIVLSCMGGAAGCSQAALATYLAAQTKTDLCPVVASVWHCATKAQTSTLGAYNDPEPYGALMNYAVQSAWSSGGGVSAATPILIFQMPQAPNQTAPVPATPSASFVTTGNVG